MRAKLKTISTVAAVHIPTEGVYIRREGPGDFAIYVNGIYCGSRGDFLTAESEGRAVLFEALRRDQIVTADASAEYAEVVAV